MSGNAMPSDMPQRRKYVMVAGVALFAVLATTAMAWSQGIMINETPSFPQGIYQKYPREARVRRGQMVVACPPDEPMYHLALQRHYLRPGLCPSGTEPLIKKVVGLPGDTILVGRDVRVNGHPIANSTVYPTDGDDRPMKAWTNGKVPAGQLFLMSDYREDSFDSRYTGPLPDHAVLSYIKPLWTFD